MSSNNISIDTSSINTNVFQIMRDNWNKAGFTTPNKNTYPYQWLWDSCFHSLIWAKLGDEKKYLQELRNIFKVQTYDGFIPHINFSFENSSISNDWLKLWGGRTKSSCITQPPMYGLALAELKKMGIKIPEEIIYNAQFGFEFLLNTRKRDSKTGLVYLCHPWETGIDNSPRWDNYIEGDFTVKKWNKNKRDLLQFIDFGDSNSPKFNSAFPVISVGFNSLIAFNILEFEKEYKINKFSNEATEIIEALNACFNSKLKTWVDPVLKNKERDSGKSNEIKVLDALLAGLVSEQHIDLIYEQLVDSKAFGGDFGPPSVHRGEVSYKPNEYWRGSTWPQMTYLFWLMAKKHGWNEISDNLAEALLKGALKSGFAEHWNSDTGEGLGAIPQSWAGLVLLTI